MLPTPSYAQPIVSVFACSEDAELPPTTATATTATAVRATSALPRFLISALLSTPWLCLPRCFLSSDQRVEQSMERDGHVVPFRLPDERAGDQLDLGLAVRVDVLEHLRVVRRASFRREDVHLPRVVVELDARGRRHGLPLFDETMHEVTELARPRLLREVQVVRESRQRRGRVDRRIEDELRPLSGTQVEERLGLQARRDDRVRDVLNDRERRFLV